MTSDVPRTRRDFVKAAAAMAAATSSVQTVSAAAGSRVAYGVIGSGQRGCYLLRHMAALENSRCVAVCDSDERSLKQGIAAAGTNPQGHKNYRVLLDRNDIEAVVIATPLYAHFPAVRDALLAGKHVFCETTLVFKPEEVHQLRVLAADRPNQVFQVGFQRRYSEFYQTAKLMVAKGLIGNVTHVIAQWHRNPGWLVPPDLDRDKQRYWFLYREYSGGLVSELASHQIDVACWMFGSQPEYVVGVGGQEFLRDGRDTYDNIQLIFRYPRGQKLICTAISTNQQLPLFGGTRAEVGERIMGTGGTIEITVGTNEEPAIALWYYEPRPAQITKAGKAQEDTMIGGATLGSTGYGRKGFPLLLKYDQFSSDESFVGKEMKYARRWLYSKGIMLPEEGRNTVNVQMESFFDCCRTAGRPKAGVEVGLTNSTAVILSNLAMEEGRRVYFDEFEKMGRDPADKRRTS